MNNFDKKKRQQHQDEDENTDDEDDGQLQPEANNATAALTTKVGGESHLSGKECERASPSKRQRLLPSRDLSLKPSRDVTKRGAIAIIAATTSLIALKPSQARMIGGHSLLSGNGRFRLTLAQRKGSASATFSRRLPSRVGHAPRVGTIRSHSPISIRVQKSPWAPAVRVNCLRRPVLHQKPWILRCRLTAAP